MLPLPPVTPILGHHSRVRLGRDYYVRVAGNDYSVDPTMIGKMVEITAGLEEVTVTAEGRHGAAPTGLGEQVDRHRPGPRRDRGQAPRHVRPACFDLSR